MALKKPFELVNDGKQSERFADALQKIVKVPKAEVDRQLKLEEEARKASKTEARKRRS